MQLEPIQTYYNGIKFRSRTEARWAVFFDALGVPYIYEKEGYDLGQLISAALLERQGSPEEAILIELASLNLGWYLPDFWLPNQELWVEIKGGRPTELDWDKVRALKFLSGYRCHLFFGGIPNYVRYKPDLSDGEIICNEYHDAWCICPTCGTVSITFEGRCSRLPCGCFKGKDHIRTCNHPVIIRACKAARSARFEYGEHPVLPSWQFKQSDSEAAKSLS